MQKNIVILTSGLSGSSVLTALICRAGYWSGESTQQKEDYNTHENKELIQLNLKLFSQAGYSGHYTTEFSKEAITRLGELHETLQDNEYQAFLEKCNQHQPWIWKDPRLWLTIRFWKNILNLQECRFILLTRGYTQSWISALLRRQIRTYSDYATYERQIQSSITSFLGDNQVPYLHVRYETLILRPLETLGRLNTFLETNLTIEDLQKVYHKPLFKNPRPSLPNHLKAVLIYLKNYPRGSASRVVEQAISASGN